MNQIPRGLPEMPALLDILFAGRNKAYGAYELRKSYPKRLWIALAFVCSVLALSFIGVIIYETITETFKEDKVEVKSVVLENIQQPEKKIEEPPPPPKPKELKMKTIKLTTPKIAPDEEVTAPPPSLDEIPNAKIDNYTQEGVNFDEAIAPPDDGVGQGPPTQGEEEPILEKVEQQAEFPGGAKAWLRFVEREIQKHMDELVDAGFSGTVEVQFIVDKKGKVSEVKALTNPGTRLAEIAVNAIKNGPNWIPAVNHGQPVTSYRKQPVTFRAVE